MNTLPVKRYPLLLESALAALLCAVVLLATSPILPMTWDEGNAINRAAQIPGQWLYTATTEAHPEIEGHPAFYGIVIAFGRWVCGGWLPPLEAARFGPMMLFALAAGAMFYRLGRDFSVAAAIGAVAALMLMPRMFAHAHFASIDGPLTSCWILAWAMFVPAVRGIVVPGKVSKDTSDAENAQTTVRQRINWPATLLFGITLGMTLGSKATGWLAPVPFLVWAAVYRDRTAAKVLAIGLPIALLSFFLLNPPLWYRPIAGWNEFFYLNLNRPNISTWFLGRMYDLYHSLPWYNTLFWTAVTVPVAILALAGVGIVRAVGRCRTDRLAVLLLANWLVLIIVRALPGIPPHDGIRLFLPAFAFLAALAGVGCDAMFSWSRKSSSRRSGDMEDDKLPEGEDNDASEEGKTPEGNTPANSGGSEKVPNKPTTSLRASSCHCLTTAALLLLLAITTAVNLFIYCPQWLSYYNILIGGVPGATAAGMEPTYYWDGLDRSVLDWLHDHTADDERVLFAASSPENFALMQEWDVLRREWFVPDPRARCGVADRYHWYVLQRRPSGCYGADVWLIENAEPVHRKTLLGVPVVEVYRIEDYRRAWEAIAAEESLAPVPGQKARRLHPMGAVTGSTR